MRIDLNLAGRAPLLLLLLAVAGVPGLKDVQVAVPEAAAAGDTVSLHCRYDLEQDTLYSVKWYKGRQEFFRYIPKELPHTKVFPLQGVDVDVGRSGPASVVLRAVSPSVSGRYRCEVSADAPSFHTAMKTSYMHVVELPESAPIITSEKTRVSVGETLRAHCTAPPAHPPANLTWFLNNAPVKGTTMDLDPPAHQKPTKPGMEHAFPASRNVTRMFGQINVENGNEPENEYLENVVRGQRNVDKIALMSKNAPKSGEDYIKKNIEDYQQKKGLEEKLFNHGDQEVEGVKTLGFDGPGETKPIVKKSSGSSLVMVVRQENFQQGRLTLTCRATVFSLYNAQAHFSMDGENPQIASVVGTRESSSGADTTYSTEVLCLSLLLLASRW